MKFIKSYKGFNITFIVPPAIRAELFKEHLSLDKLFDTWMWFEEILFEDIDEDMDGVPDSKFGDSFSVLILGIVSKWHHKKPKGVFSNIRYDRGNALSTGKLKISSKWIQYVLLMKENSRGDSK